MADLARRLGLAARALTTLKQLLPEPLTPIVRDALVQRFEYTFEAIWQSARHVLTENEGLDAASPAHSIRACHDLGLIDEATSRRCLQMVADRNLTVHTYEEEMAAEVAARVKDHAILLECWLKALEDRFRSTQQ